MIQAYESQIVLGCSNTIKMTKKSDDKSNEILTSHKDFSKNEKFRGGMKALDTAKERNDYFYKSPYRYIYVRGYESLNSRMRWVPIIKEIIKFKQEGKILDIGCAYGFFLKFLPNSFEKYGVDKSKIAVSHARLENPEAKIFLGDFIKTKFEKNKFDIITAFETLEHITDLKEIIEKVQNLLKKDGYFIASFPVVESFLEKKWFTMFDKTHINHSDKVLNEIKRKFNIILTKYTFDCVKFIIIPKYRIFPVHQSYFIIAHNK